MPLTPTLPPNLLRYSGEFEQTKADTDGYIIEHHERDIGLALALTLTLAPTLTLPRRFLFDRRAFSCQCR